VYLTDQLGSVRDVVDASTGSLVGSLDYRPYGQIRRQSGSVSPLYQFAQLPWDGNAGLSVSATRFYDANFARWMSRDPIGEAGGINLYGYVGASPTLEFDPEGLQGKSIAGPVARTLNRLRKIIRQCFFPKRVTFPPMRVNESQMGAKLGKHVKDFGGNPANPVDRAKVRSIVDDIGNSPEKVVDGTFMGQGPNGTRGAVQFRIKDNDVVVTKPDGEFVTILKDGINNTSVKKALGELE
jgi:RHS repeat-associated protein